MKVPLLDLTAQYKSIRWEVRMAIDRVCESQAFILGPEVTACEHEIASFCGARHAIGVSSGTDALLVALMAAGVGPGDDLRRARGQSRNGRSRARTGRRGRRGSESLRRTGAGRFRRGRSLSTAGSGEASSSGDRGSRHRP